MAKHSFQAQPFLEPKENKLEGVQQAQDREERGDKQR